jgi:hypothetical protein
MPTAGRYLRADGFCTLSLQSNPCKEHQVFDSLTEGEQAPASLVAGGGPPPLGQLMSLHPPRPPCHLPSQGYPRFYRRLDDIRRSLSENWFYRVVRGSLGRKRTNVRPRGVASLGRLGTTSFDRCGPTRGTFEFFAKRPRLGHSLRGGESCRLPVEPRSPLLARQGRWGSCHARLLSEAWPEGLPDRLQRWLRLRELRRQRCLGEPRLRPRRRHLGPRARRESG